MDLVFPVSRDFRLYPAPKKGSAVKGAVLSELTPVSNSKFGGREERRRSLRKLSISDIEDAALCDKNCVVRER
ncbi:hypothetical protein DPMN_083931 [Dreissena polymorpha]|uniref:Uncharacterized protein n=1 Tax=Dreissena polymorpha TaxID=45954 RepID=A0A9D3YC92_DREPO|nr:hypothetical protein DPMN_083931 [Dreissena polymorpha]